MVMSVLTNDVLLFHFVPGRTGTGCYVSRYISVVERNVFFRLTIQEYDGTGCPVMSKRKKIKVREAKAEKNIKLGWKIRRQIQQEILQKRLVECFLKPGERRHYLERYPEAMQPMIKDFIREAEKQTRLHTNRI